MKLLFLTAILVPIPLLAQSAASTSYKPDFADAANGVSVETMLNQSISVLAFGADSTGEHDSLPAFNAAKRKVVAMGGGRIYVPQGKFIFTSGYFIMDANNLHLGCERGARIAYAGTLDVPETILAGNDIGNYGTQYAGQSIDGCRISGNGYVTKAILHLSNTISAEVSNVDLKEGPTCLLVDWGNTVTIRRPLCTQYNGLMTIVPARGIVISHMNNVHIIDPSVEDLGSTPVPGGNRALFAQWAAGIVTMQTTTPHGLSTGSLVRVAGVGGAVSTAYSVASVAVTVIDAYMFKYPLAANPGDYMSPVTGGGTIARLSDGAVFRVGPHLSYCVGIEITVSGPVIIDGGTSEGQNYGVTIDGLSSDIDLNRMDNESNFDADLQTSGSRVHVNGGVWMYYIHIVDSGPGTSRGQQTTLDHVATGQISIDPNVTGVTLTNSTYGNTGLNGATVSNRGTRTTILNLCSANTAAGCLTNMLYGIQISSDWSTVGFGTAPAVVSDDPGANVPAFQTASNFFKLGLGARKSPTCDATYGHGDFWYDQGAAGVTGATRMCVKDAANGWSWRPFWYDGIYPAIVAGTGLTGGGQLIPGATVTLNATPAAPAINQTLFSSVDTPGASPASANNALVMTMTDPLTGRAWVEALNRPFYLGIQHTLRAGPNTLNLNGGGPKPILLPSGADLTIGFSACCSVVIELIARGTYYQLLSTQQ